MPDDLPVDLAEFGRRVRSAREARRLPLRELARRVDIHVARLSQAQRGLKLSHEDYTVLRRWLDDEGSAGVPVRR